MRNKQTYNFGLFLCVLGALDCGQYIGPVVCNIDCSRDKIPFPELGSPPSRNAGDPARHA